MGLWIPAFGLSLFVEGLLNDDSFVVATAVEAAKPVAKLSPERGSLDWGRARDVFKGIGAHQHCRSGLPSRENNKARC